MTKDDMFSESFWDSDITSIRGYDIIVRRMKDGRKVCKELEEYLKERAKADSAYSRALRTVARKLEGKCEIGGLGDSIHELKAHTEKTASAYEENINNLQVLLMELQTFREDQDKTKNMREDGLKRQQQNKLQHYQKTCNMKERYVQRCRDYDMAEAAYMTASKSVTTPAKELSKCQKNEEKGKENRDNADIMYRSSIDGLEQARNSWEAEMEGCCKEFQCLEEQRIIFTRNLMWKVSNIDSQASVIQDESAECVRLKLEQCDIDRDLKTFVHSHQLGSTRPGLVAYESYYKDSYGKNRENSNRRQQHALPQATSLTQNAKIPISPPVRPQPPPPPSPQKTGVLINFDDNYDDGAYASISNTEIQKNREAKIIRHHVAKVEASERL